VPYFADTLGQTAEAARTGNRAVVFLQWDGYPTPSSWNPQLPASFYLTISQRGAAYGDPVQAFFTPRVSISGPGSTNNGPSVEAGLLTSYFGFPGDVPLTQTPGFSTADIQVLPRPAPGSSVVQPADWSAFFGAYGRYAIAFPVGERVFVRQSPNDPSQADYGDWDIVTYTYDTSGTTRATLVPGGGFLEAIPSDRPQISRITIGGVITAGVQFTATVAGTPYTVTAGSGDTGADIAAALTTAIAANAALIVTDESAAFVGTTYGGVKIEGAVANVPFTLSVATNANGLVLAGVITQVAT
jgi:hypothetical protein